MKKILLFLGVILSINSFSQVTWSDDVASIFYNNCTQCHHDNGIAPFSLMTYEEASDNSAGMDFIVESGLMPPWSADTEYQEYAHERVLSEEDIATLSLWVNTGTLPGDLADAPPAPIYPEDGFISVPSDVEVQIPTYTSQASAFADDYVCFSIPLGLTADKKLRAFEVIPGNAQIVHHALAYIDSSGTYETDLSGFCGGPTQGLIGGYTPGAEPTVFPSNGDDINMGVTIPAGSNLVMAMHYPEGSAGEVDDTKIRLYFYDDETEIREISTDPIIQNWFFNLPPNEVTDVTASYGLIPVDVSILSVFPHMHLLGTNIKSFGVTLDDDTLNFVNIPEWDFEWQQFYFFSQVQHVPAWTTIYGEGSYDNTAANPFNPNDPPIAVNPGLNTSDEMFLVYFHYLAYQDGDEDINLDELTSLPTLINELNQSNNLSINVYPNPFVDEMIIEMNLESSSKVSLFIYDNQGKLIEILEDRNNVSSGVQQWKWNPSDDLPSGVYHYSILVNGVSGSGMLIKN